MANVGRVKSSRWENIDNIFCLIVESADGNAIAIPSEGLSTLAGEGRRRAMAQLLKEQNRGAGVWASALLLSVQTWNVGTTDTGTVALILDRGMDTEIQYHLIPEYARGVARLLLEEADKADQIGKSAH